MGFATDNDDTLNLDPVKAEGWKGILKNWTGDLDPRLTAPTGISDWETHSAALTLTELAGPVRGSWDLLEACGMVSYESGKPKKPRAERSAVIKYPRPGQ